MKQYPADMADFMRMFSTDDACLEYLSIVRWPDGYSCLRCGKGQYWKKARGLFTCRACGYEASVLAGTLFQDTHKPLRLWFQAMWYVVKGDAGLDDARRARELIRWIWYGMKAAQIPPGRAAPKISYSCLCLMIFTPPAKKGVPAGQPLQQNENRLNETCKSLFWVTATFTALQTACLCRCKIANFFQR
jgi:hypothetical protein